MRHVLQKMHQARRPPLHSMLPYHARASYEAAAQILEVPKPPLDRVEDFTVTARDGFALPARLYAPDASRLPVMMYLHGGGFTIGSINTHDILCRELARLSHCAVVSLGYRLAPEHKFPTAVHDAWDALQWLAGHGASLGLDATRLAVGGDSAGGTLATVCASLAREAGLALALQVLFYPGCASHQDTRSHQQFASGLLLDEPHITWFFKQYTRGRADREHWWFAPLHTPDLEGVAPVWMGLAELDPLVDEGIDYADRLRAVGVPVALEIYHGVVHDFIKMGRAIPEARQAHAAAAAAIRHAFDKKETP